jgi:hypothetical protein
VVVSRQRRLVEENFAAELCMPLPKPGQTRRAKRRRHDNNGFGNRRSGDPNLRIRLCFRLCVLFGTIGPVLCPLCAQSRAPYGPSPVIQGVVWDFKHLTRLANTPGKGGSDLWPTTWAKDGNIYTGWGDGGGFEGASDNLGRVSLGFVRMIGFPPRVKGVDVWGYYPKYAEHPATFCGKAYSMLSVDGVLYAWISSWYNPDAANFVRCAPNPHAPQDRLAWSDDLGATWTLSPWKLEQARGQPVQFGWFLNFGANDSHSRDQYVYQYVRVWGEGNATYLSRVRPTDLQKAPTRSRLYEYYAGRGPVWSVRVSKARPVFFDHNGRQIAHVVYNFGFRRYIASVQGRSVGETGLFDAPEP